MQVIKACDVHNCNLILFEQRYDSTSISAWCKQWTVSALCVTWLEQKDIASFVGSQEVTGVAIFMICYFESLLPELLKYFFHFLV